VRAALPDSWRSPATNCKLISAAREASRQIKARLRTHAEVVSSRSSSERCCQSIRTGIVAQRSRAGGEHAPGDNGRPCEMWDRYFSRSERRFGCVAKVGLSLQVPVRLTAVRRGTPEACKHQQTTSPVCTLLSARHVSRHLPVAAGGPSTWAESISHKAVSGQCPDVRPTWG
jgi:hypothetical protein